MAVKLSAPVGDGIGVQKFSIKPGGMGLQMESSVPAPAPIVPVAPESAPSVPESAPPPTPFQRLYPGVDPASVEMVFDEGTRKVRFKPIESPEVPTIPAEIQSPAPAVPVSAAPDDPVAQLRAELAQRDQLMTAMLTAQMTGRPIGEILSGIPVAPSEPDYSNLDLYDDAQRTQFIRQMREDNLAQARAEVRAQIAPHLPSIQNAQRVGERALVETQYGKDPNHAQIAAKTEEFIAGNPNISFRDTYNLILRAQVQPAASTPAASNGTPPNVAPTLTPAQQVEKAAQAARYPAREGGRALGAPTPPPGMKNWKQHATWVAQMLDRGYSPQDILAAGKNR